MLTLLSLLAVSHAQDAAVSALPPSPDAAALPGADLAAEAGAAWFGAELASALLPDRDHRWQRARKLLVPAAGWLAAVLVEVVVCGPTSWPAVLACAAKAGGPALVAVLGHRLTRKRTP